MNEILTSSVLDPLKVSVIISKESKIDYKELMVREAIYQLLDNLSLEELNKLFTIKEELKPLYNELIISINENIK